MAGRKHIRPSIARSPKVAYHWEMRSLATKLMLGLLILIVPLSILLTAQNRYAIAVVRDQAAETSRSLAIYQMSRIDKELSASAAYLDNLLASSEQVVAMESSAGGTEYQLSKILLSNLLNRDLGLYPIVDCLFYYSLPTKDFMDVCSNPGIFQEKLRVRDFLTASGWIARSAMASNQDKWTIFKVGEEAYLLHTVTNGTSVLGAWVRFKRLLPPLQNTELGAYGEFLFVAKDGTLLTPSASLGAIKLSTPARAMIKGFGGANFLLVKEASISGAFALGALVADKEMLRNLPNFQLVISLMSILAVAILPIYLLVLKRSVLKPLKKIVAATVLVARGDLSHRLEPEKSSLEFERLRESFNAMLDEIKHLKISAYEERLAKQSAELQQLQLQIKPHFLLNTLNLIYHLAQLGKTDRIQSLIMDMVHYFRFMFRNNLEAIDIKEELALVEAYLRIQNDRSPGSVSLAVAMEPTNLAAMIPPLLIHTFVENAIKHALSLERPLSISIALRMDEQEAPGRCLMIVVEDNGPGFPEEVLERIKRETKPSDQSERHVGIWNVQRRLALIYGGKASFSCSNRAEGGARVEMAVPAGNAAIG